MSSVLGQIRRECLDELSALGALARVPLLAEDRGDVGAGVARALAWDGGGLGRCGAFIYFLTESASARGMGDWGPVFGEIPIGIMTAEVPELNRGANGTGLTALELAEVVMAGLNLHRPASANGPLVLRDPAVVPVEFDVGAETLLPGYEVRFELPGSLAVRLEEIAPVVISEDGSGHIVMNCATDGAAIFFTTDLSRPNPQTGTLYQGPVSGLYSGTVVRARAFLSGRLLAAVSEYTVTGAGDATYLVDENGNRLTDENGNRLIVE
jgi:hypothetical protein